MCEGHQKKMDNFGRFYGSGVDNSPTKAAAGTGNINNSSGIPTVVPNLKRALSSPTLLDERKKRKKESMVGVEHAALQRKFYTVRDKMKYKWLKENDAKVIAAFKLIEDTGAKLTKKEFSHFRNNQWKKLSDQEKEDFEVKNCKKYLSSEDCEILYAYLKLKRDLERSANNTTATD